MNALLRAVSGLALLPLAGFSVFGFLATFEPMPASTQWTWRAIYLTIAIVCTWTILRLWRSRRERPGPTR